MSKSKLARLFFLLVVIPSIIALVSIACGSTTTEKLQEAVDVPTSTTTIVESPVVTPANKEPEATSTKPQAQAKPLELVAYGFGQDGQELGCAFLVENPNDNVAFESTQYQIAVYDATGTVIQTESGFIEIVLPGQKLGIASTMYLNEGITAAKMEVQLLEGDSVPTDPVLSLTAKEITYFEGEYFDSVTGIIENPYNSVLENIRVSAIAYNDAGEIIGSGFTFVNFIQAKSSTGVDIPIVTSGDVAKIEIYPTVSGLTFLGEKPALPEGASDVKLTKQGYGQDGQEVGFGMIIENPNASFAVENSKYRVVAYAEDGRVLGVEENYVEVLLPNQTLGIAGVLFLVENTKVERVEAQLLAGDFVESDSLPFITTENVTYRPDNYWPKVTGQIVSPYSKNITNLRVSAILYNQAGEIIGGGFTYLDFLPANGKAAVEVLVTSGGSPSSAELYAAVSALSEFK